MPRPRRSKAVPLPDAVTPPTIDLNADVGESYGAWSMGDDAALLPLVTSANVACGAHAGDPVVMARSESIARAGGDAFAEYTLPAAAILLKQGFGRLLRSSRDAGVVALLDRRTLTKRYGRALLAALPPAKRLLALADVRAFWGMIGSMDASAAG